MSKSPINLKLVTAYWCNRVSPDYEDRFEWSSEEIDEDVEDIGARARMVLVALAKSAPDDYNAAYFAAGPLENYINLVVEKADANEAAFIVNNPHLKKLLKFVWGDIKKLKPLARQKDADIVFQDPSIGSELRTLDLNDVVGFWCHMCVPSMVENYDRQYERVIEKLLNKQTRERTMHDLLISAPDDRAIAYLKDNIFVLRG